MTILLPSGDHVTARLSPCSTRDVSDLARYASGVDGWRRDSENIHPEVNVERTRTRQTVIACWVTAQNRDLRGLGAKESMFSSGTSGKAGAPDSRLAADVGKYIPQGSKQAEQEGAESAGA